MCSIIITERNKSCSKLNIYPPLRYLVDIYTSRNIYTLPLKEPAPPLVLFFVYFVTNKITQIKYLPTQQKNSQVKPPHLSFPGILYLSIILFSIFFWTTNCSSIIRSNCSSLLYFCILPVLRVTTCPCILVCFLLVT